jgi:hypothetical protein
LKFEKTRLYEIVFCLILLDVMKFILSIRRVKVNDSHSHDFGEKVVKFSCEMTNDKRTMITMSVEGSSKDTREDDNYSLLKHN